MKKTAFFLSCLLAAVMIAASLAACAGPSGGDNTTPAAPPPEDQTPGPDTAPAETEPSFRFADYGGDEFVVYQRRQDLNDYAGKYIVPDESASDVISDEAVRRNLIVSQKFNIEIKAIETNNPYSTIMQDINGGECPYDLVLDRRRYVAPLGLDGALVNLNKLEADYTTHWWDAKAAYSYSAGGKLFVIPNDVSVGNLEGARFFFFNKQVLEDFHLTSPYEYVSKNEWILDTFISMVKSVSAPNADGTLGVYGLLDEDNSVRNHCLVGCGVEWITKVDENTFEVRIGTDYALRAQDYLDKINALRADVSCCLEMAEASGMDPAGSADYEHKYDHGRGLFAQGHFLFTQSQMECAYQFADMAKGFGVVVNPKYDADQAEYYHKMDSNSIIFCIAKLSGIDAQKTVNILDYWGYVASSTSMEAYYELTLKIKRASDPTTAEMLDTVKASIAYPISDLFTSGSYKIDVGALVNDASTTSVAKAWSAHQKSIGLTIKRVMTKLGELED